MKYSAIDNKKILDNKSGWLSHVDYELEANSLKDFAESLLEYHIAPAIFIDGKKCQSNVASIEVACLDFDKGASSQQIHEQLIAKKLNHVMAGSKNHLKDKGNGQGIIERFHVFIPLESPITDICLYKEIVKALPIQNQWLDGTCFEVDRNCSDASRYFYKHSQILFVTDNLNNLALAQFKIRLELTKKLQAHNLEACKKKFANKDVPSLEQLKNSRWFKQDIMPLLKPGSYHLAQLKEISFLKSLGYDKESCVGFALQAKGTCNAGDYDKYCKTYETCI
jgi:hypothetical protein